MAGRRSPGKRNVRGPGGPAFHPVPVSPQWGCCVRSALWPGPGCSLEESLLLGPPHEAPHPRGSRISPWFQDAGRWKMPGPWRASGRAPAALTSSEELLCPGFSLLAPASFLLVCTVFLSQTSEFLHKYRVFEKTLLCCGLFGASMWEPRTKANSSHGKLVQSRQTWGQVSCSYGAWGWGF